MRLYPSCTDPLKQVLTRLRLHKENVVVLFWICQIPFSLAVIHCDHNAVLESDVHTRVWPATPYFSIPLVNYDQLVSVLPDLAFLKFADVDT